MPMTKQERDELRAKADDPKFAAHVYREVLVPAAQLRELLDGAEPADFGELDPRLIEKLWRIAGLPEYFLGNSGSNHALYTFVALCRVAKATVSDPQGEPEG